jgi:hypothetical protein
MSQRYVSCAKGRKLGEPESHTTLNTSRRLLSVTFPPRSHLIIVLRLSVILSGRRVLVAWNDDPRPTLQQPQVCTHPYGSERTYVDSISTSILQQLRSDTLSMTRWCSNDERREFDDGTLVTHYVRGVCCLERRRQGVVVMAGLRITCSGR